jgi:hypothetical protein
MNTSFAGNGVGSMTYLDIAGSYPTGLMAALGPIYDDPQEKITSQLRFTAAQVDLNAAYDAGYAQTNLKIQETATVEANSLNAQLAATSYKNGANQVNYANQNLSNSANTAYTNAHAVYKICCDASYVAYLMHEASHIISQKAADAIVVTSLGISVPNINPIDITSLSSMSTMVGHVEKDAHDATILAQTNALQYLFKLQSILGSAIALSTTVTVNLTLVSAFHTLVKAVLKNISDPLSVIAGKELLVTQYVPSIPLNNAIQVTRIAITCVKDFIDALSANLTTTANIVTHVASSGTLATSFDNAARTKDNSMYLSGAVAKQHIQAASTLRAYGSPISFPNVLPNTPYLVSLSSVNIANSYKKVALEADISAVNARGVSNALLALKTAFSETVTPEPMISIVANASLKILNEMMSNVTKVTSNSSAYSAVAITRRASNTINGLLAKVTQDETVSLVASRDSQQLFLLIQKAFSSAVVTNLELSQKVLWIVNAAKGKAEEISDKAKENAFILSRTAHNLVTPQTIATQTAAANTMGALNNNYASRLDRASRNVPYSPPASYSSYKADIRAKTFKPIRPTLDELVYKNRLHPLRLDSIRSVDDMSIKMTKYVQHINDISAFSFRQQ